jgi:hypothetical protein
MFEKIKPYQITALKCLASYGVIDKSYLKENKVTIVSKEVVENYSLKLEPLSIQEQNLINLLTSHFYLMSLFGENGLKERTKLLESKYDA